MKPSFRWMLSADSNEIAEIDQECFEFPWTLKDVRKAYVDNNIHTAIIEVEDKIAGYCFYEVMPTEFRILNFAIRPIFQRKGYGTALMNKMKDKVTGESRKRSKLSCFIRETSLVGQLFLRKCGFIASEIHHGVYTQTDEDAYLFEYYA